MVSLINVLKLNHYTPVFRRYLHNAFGVDARSLAIFRIAVGLVILVDLVQRSRHALTHYSDAGVLPRNVAFDSLSQYRWSIFFVNGSPTFVQAMFTLGIFAAIAMILGCKTRIATVILWVIVVSVQSRNPHLSSGADTLMRVTLFWAMFLPLARMWSLDRLTETSNDEENGTHTSTMVTSIATFGLIVQTACVYLFTAIQKDGPRWRDEGSALYYALGARDVSSNVGNWVFHNVPQSLLTVLTYGSLLLEFSIPILLLLPFKSSFLRSIAVLLIVSLHLGIAVTMSVGLFPAISIASAIGVLPTAFWSRAARLVPSKLTLRFTRRLGNANRESWRSVPTHGRAPNLAGERNGQLLHFSNSQLPAGFSISWLANFGAAVSIVIVLLWNIQTVSGYTVPQAVRPLAISSGLYQNWSMFAPGPQTATIWFVVEGELESGERFDLLVPLFEGDLSQRQPVVWNQSGDLVIEDKYWRKYFHAIRGKEVDSQRFAAYACRTWNAEHSGSERLHGLTITRGVASTGDDQSRAKPRYSEVGSWNCL